MVLRQTSNESERNCLRCLRQGAPTENLKSAVTEAKEQTKTILENAAEQRKTLRGEVEKALVPVEKPNAVPPSVRRRIDKAADELGELLASLEEGYLTGLDGRLHEIKQTLQRDLHGRLQTQVDLFNGARKRVGNWTSDSVKTASDKLQKELSNAGTTLPEPVDKLIDQLEP